MSFLRTWIEGLGIPVPEGAIDTLEEYIRELDKANQRYSFVKGDLQALTEGHIPDSLSALPMLCSSPFATLADVGSGPGLPGIPLAIFLPDKAVTLIEPMKKRSAFLELMIPTLGLQNVRVLSRPFEEIKETFDVVTFRAFKPLEPALVSALLSKVSPEGRIIAYKGKREKIEEELDRIEKNIGRSVVHPVKLPDETRQRHIVEIFPVQD